MVIDARAGIARRPPCTALSLAIALTPIVLACSNVPDRVLAPTHALSVATSEIPFAVGALHTAAIPALDQTSIAQYMPSALNDVGVIVGQRFSADTLGSAFRWTAKYGLSAGAERGHGGEGQQSSVRCRCRSQGIPEPTRFSLPATRPFGTG